jgi:hypothetical protein
VLLLTAEGLVVSLIIAMVFFKKKIFEEIVAVLSFSIFKKKV